MTFVKIGRNYIRPEDVNRIFVYGNDTVVEMRNGQTFQVQMHIDEVAKALNG